MLTRTTYALPPSALSTAPPATPRPVRSASLDGQRGLTASEACSDGAISSSLALPSTGADLSRAIQVPFCAGSKALMRGLGLTLTRIIVAVLRFNHAPVAWKPGGSDRWGCFRELPANRRHLECYSSVLRRPRRRRRSCATAPLRRPVSSSSRRGPSRRSAYLRYTHRQLAPSVHSANGSRGASALRKRRPFRARAASQLPLVEAIDTAFQRGVLCLPMHFRTYACGVDGATAGRTDCRPS